MKVALSPAQGPSTSHHAWSATAWRELLTSPAYRALRPTPRLVFQTLRNYSDITGRPCWPSVATLADACGLQVRACRAALAALEAAGLVTREYRHAPDGSPTATVYHFGRPSGLRLVPDPPVRTCRTSGTQPPQKEEHGSRSMEEKEKSMKAEYPSTSLFEPEIEELEEPDPEKVKAAATARRLDTARTRLTDQDHWTAQATKSPTRALIGWWIDRYTLQYPDLRPPVMSPQLTGHAKNMIRRCQPEGVGPVDAFRKAREVMEAAFDRRIWQLQGRDQAITLYTVIRQDVWDALVAVVAADRPDTRTAAERYAELKAEADARDRRMGVVG